MKNVWFELSTFALGACLALTTIVGTASAYKTMPRASWTKAYTTQDKKVSLQLKGKRRSVTGVTLFEGKKALAWKGKYSIPKTVLIAAAAKRVAFFGGAGNPCMELGKIYVYDFSGKIQKTVSLDKHIPNLWKLSKAYTKIAGPCFWLHGKPSAKGNSLVVNVCKKKTATVNLKTWKVSVK